MCAAVNTPVQTRVTGLAEAMPEVHGSLLLVLDIQELPGKTT